MKDKRKTVPVRERVQNEKRKIGKVVGLSLVLLAIAAITQLVASNTLAGRGGELGELEKEVSHLSYTNQLLKSELAQKSSLSAIAAESAELGFGKPESVLYVDVSEPVAILP